METPSQQLAEAVIRTVTGPMWHGDALAEQLSGVTYQQATARPVPGAHTIWELVLHLTGWADIVRARLHGERLDGPPADVDWPAPAAPNRENWSAAMAALEERHRALAGEVIELGEQTLNRAVASLGYSHATMIRGVVEHGAYHGGQIGVLKRALSRS